MVEYNGKTYERDKRGKYRCPARCGHPDYPQPSWTTEKGFLKHLAECGEKVWTPESKPEREKFADCEDCGTIIWMYTSFWEMKDRIVCIECYKPYFDLGVGFHSCAGLILPDITLGM